MTQKELLYVEDAICHEKVIINCINNIIDDLEDEDLIDYMNNELETHEEMNKNLMNLLEKCNDWSIFIR